MDITPCPRAQELEAIATRFWPKVDLLAKDDCHRWLARISRGGYGHFAVAKGIPIEAHRVAWLLAYGIWPPADGMCLDHLCHDPHTCMGGRTCLHRRCVNTNHLAIVTHGENVRRSSRVVKTHCKQGHLFDKENTFHWSRYPEQRLCRACRRDAVRLHSKKKKEGGTG